MKESKYGFLLVVMNDRLQSAKVPNALRSIVPNGGKYSNQCSAFWKAGISDSGIPNSLRTSC